MQPAAIDALWEYSDPAGSEERFRAALADISPELRLELLTQIARTYSLRKRFDEAHAMLDEVERELPGFDPRPCVRYLLERGRTLNSSGEAEKARELFCAAWEQADVAQLDGLAVDAAHMVGITYAGTADAAVWNARGLDLARRSQDVKAQALIPALLNNSAWDLHDLGRCEEALPVFEAAEAAWREREHIPQIRAARWAVARCLRSLARHAEALRILRELEAEHSAAGAVPDHIYEDLAENLSALGHHEEARSYADRVVKPT